jgi:transcriptional regulator with XRE-family HTH domain
VQTVQSVQTPTRVETTFGQRLGELRRARGLSQRDLAIAAGISETYVQTLGGWASLDMVARYTKDQQAEDALRAQRAHMVVDRLL